MFENGVEDSEQLAHTGSKSDFGLLPCSAETLIEGSDDEIVLCGCQCSHVEGASYLRSSSPDGALSSEVAAIAIEGSYTDQGSYLLTVQGAQLRETSQEGGREYRAYPRDAPQQVVLLPPYRAPSDTVPETIIQFVYFPLQAGNMGLDKVSYYLAAGRPEAILLRRNHLHHLTSAGQESREFPGLGIG